MCSRRTESAALASDPDPSLAHNAAHEPTSRLLLWFVHLGARHPAHALLLLLLNLVMVGLGLAVLTITGLNLDLLRHAVDPSVPQARWPLGLHPPADWTTLEVLVSINLVAIVLAVVRAVLRYSTSLATGMFVQKILTALRSAVYDKLQRLSFRFFDANETGSIINRATSDATHMAGFVEYALIQVVVVLIALTANLIYMTQIHVTLTLLCLATTPLLAIASVIYSRMVQPGYDKNRKLYDNLVRRLSENTQGRHVVEGFALQAYETGRFHEANDEYRNQQRWLFRRTSGYSAIVHFLSSLNLVMVLGVGGYMVVHDHAITVGQLVIFASLLGQLSNQIAALANVANSMQVSLVAARRVREVLNAPMEIESRGDCVRLPKARGHVAFDKVSFAYKSDEPVLRDVSFTVEPGQCVAVLGPTGSGKSSLLSLIPRFYDPSSGAVRVDGHDVREVHLDDLRRNIGLVFQDNFLFSNTVAFNIGFGRPDATRAQIEKAAKVAAAHDFIMELEKGYDTIIGEHGAGLSGGQRQRIAIARAVLLEPSILILDDATAAVDPETEAEILEAMDNAMQGRTTFVIAHRLSSLRRADFIVVLDKGRVVEVGTHEQLMKRKGGLYQSVARAQMVDPESQWIMRARDWYLGKADTPFLDTTTP
jgi:ATP-binding cassette subfamily B protein